MTKTEILRAEYSKVERVDPEGQAYKNLCAFLDARTDRELKELVEARIKWVSSLALNRCIRRGALCPQPQRTSPAQLSLKLPLPQQPNRLPVTLGLESYY